MLPAWETTTWQVLAHLRACVRWQPHRAKGHLWSSHPTRLTLLRILVRTLANAQAHAAELRALLAQGPPPASPPPRPRSKSKEGEPTGATYRKARRVHSNIVNDARMQLP